MKTKKNNVVFRVGPYSVVRATLLTKIFFGYLGTKYFLIEEDRIFPLASSRWLWPLVECIEELMDSGVVSDEFIEYLNYRFMHVDIT